MIYIKGIIDRIENDILVIEIDKKMYNVNIEKAVGKVEEGDCVDVTFEGEEITKVIRNEKETLSRKEYIQNLVKDMWE